MLMKPEKGSHIDGIAFYQVHPFHMGDDDVAGDERSTHGG